MTPEVHALLMSAVQTTPNEAFLNFLIPAVVGLGKGLLDRAAAKKQQKKDAEAAERLRNTPQITTTRHKFNAKQFLADAAAAGFNPVTWLMSGGASSSTTSLSKTTGQNAAAAAQLETRTQVPSIGQSIMGGIEAGASAFLSGQQQQQQNAFQERMQKMYLQGAQAPGALRSSRFLDVPNRAHIGQLTTMDNYSTGTPINTAIGPQLPVGWEAGKVDVTNPYYRGNVDPSVANASAFTDRYGESEILEMIIGVGNLGADFLYNLTGTTHAERDAAARAVYGNPISDAVKGIRDWWRTPSNAVSSETVYPASTWGGMEPFLFKNPAKIK
ncbi:hypothetical protein [Flyfo microvirus Tbat2_95]|nr:hypothetical protein [Flyfo microvirus Tbat2_95]